MHGSGFLVEFIIFAHSYAIISLVWQLYMCHRDKDGYYWLTGRVDDVINVRYRRQQPKALMSSRFHGVWIWIWLLFFCFRFSGHRIGTAEVESALVSHPQCAEAAVVGVEHEVLHFLFFTMILHKCSNPISLAIFLSSSRLKGRAYMRLSL